MFQNVLTLDQINNLKTSLGDVKYVFLSISGAHLYGFESFNSDLDIRGAHFPKITEILRYFNCSDTLDKTFLDGDIWLEEVDVVSHSLLKYLHLLAKQPNGYILEQVFSPLIIQTTDIHLQIQQIAKLTITKDLHFHYNGFFQNQTNLLSKQKKELKLCLYQLRIICTAVFLARFGKINANLLDCNKQLQIFDQDNLVELVNLKKAGEKNNFPSESIKSYWLNEVESKQELISSEILGSSLPKYNQELVYFEIESFIKQYLLQNIQI